MREIQLEGKVYRTTHQTITSLIWATRRKGGPHYIWKDDKNVCGAILDYWNEHNVLVFKGDRKQQVKHIRNIIERLADEGYAEFVADGPRTALTLFKFKGDVDLGGWKPDTPKMRDDVETQVEGTAEVLNLHPTPTIPIIPLPPAPTPPRWKKDEINNLLDKWAELDNERYADWADSVVIGLEALFNG